MPVKLRLQRHGKKGRPFYYIVAADARAPRDGKFIERVGSYNPNTNPATIHLDVEKSLKWVKDGAQPTDTVRAILSYKGVLLRHHLSKGVDKGALTADQADSKFNSWLDEKQGIIEDKKKNLASNKAGVYQDRLQAEQEYNRKRAEAILAKNTPAPEAAPVAEADSTENEEVTTSEENSTEENTSAE